MTGEDGSYELKYNKIENLFGELTRLMDNMESTLPPQNNTNVIIFIFNLLFLLIKSFNFR